MEAKAPWRQNARWFVRISAFMCCAPCVQDFHPFLFSHRTGNTLICMWLVNVGKHGIGFFNFLFIVSGDGDNERKVTIYTKRLNAFKSSSNFIGGVSLNTEKVTQSSGKWESTVLAPLLGGMFPFVNHSLLFPIARKIKQGHFLLFFHKSFTLNSFVRKAVFKSTGGYNWPLIFNGSRVSIT